MIPNPVTPPVGAPAAPAAPGLPVPDEVRNPFSLAVWLLLGAALAVAAAACARWVDLPLAIWIKQSVSDGVNESFEWVGQLGESGPYIQYAVVRANNIFQKLQQRDGVDERSLLQTLADIPAGELTGENGDHELWSLVLEASRLDEVVEQVIRTLEFSVLAKYAFTLAQAFNAFYHRSPILNEERDDVRRWRAATVIYLRNQLTRTLDLMGVTVPTRM